MTTMIYNGRCICGMLSEKCVILVTHQIQYLNQCDVILELREVTKLHHL